MLLKKAVGGYHPDHVVIDRLRGPVYIAIPIKLKDPFPRRVPTENLTLGLCQVWEPEEKAAPVEITTN